MDHNKRSQGDGYETPERGRADCSGCNGSGSVRAFAGDEEILAPCEDCGGMGYELTRDEFANLDALQGDRDLRLVPESDRVEQMIEDEAEAQSAWPVSRRTA